jgi:hypothetical protein
MSVPLFVRFMKVAGPLVGRYSEFEALSDVPGVHPKLDCEVGGGGALVQHF